MKKDILDEEVVPDYSEDELVVPVYEDLSDDEKVDVSKVNIVDDKTLELKDLELDKTVNFESTICFEDELKKELINDKIKEIIDKTDDYDIEQELKESLNKRKKQKKYGYILTVFSSLFVPILIFLKVISVHSNELVTKDLVFIINILLAIFVTILVIGLVILIRNFKIYLEIKTKKILITAYIFFEAIYIVGLSTVGILLYGPAVEFKEWLVTTAMNTKDHQYYATWFYNKDEIQEVFNNNYILEPTEDTDTTMYQIDEEPVIEYANKYEKQVLVKDEGNDDYKLITFNVNGCKAYLAVIYDPANVSVTTTKHVGSYGEYVVDMAKREKAIIAINGGGFKDPNHSSTGGMPRGVVIKNSKIVTDNTYGKTATGGIIGFTKENKLVLLKNTSAKTALKKGIRDAVSWGPFLIVNGKAAFTKGNGGWGYAARTAIGQRKDGIVLFLVVDSNYNRTKGANMTDMTKIMKNYGAINAANLDGGTSSVMVVNGKMISHPIDGALRKQTRPIATSFIMTKKNN